MKRSLWVLFLVSVSVFVGLTGRMSVPNVAMDGQFAEASVIVDPPLQQPRLPPTGYAPPVRVVLFADDPEGDKDACLLWFVSVQWALRRPKEIRQIRAYENVDPTLRPRWLIEFEFDRFLDMAAYLNRPEIAEIFEDLPNHLSDVKVQTFIRRSDYANGEKGDWSVKRVFLVNYRRGGKHAYLAWIKSISGALGEIPELKASASYDNYYGAAPHRFAEHAFETLEAVAAYDALEYVKGLRAALDVRTQSWSEHTFVLRSYYHRE